MSLPTAFCLKHYLFFKLKIMNNNKCNLEKILEIQFMFNPSPICYYWTPEIAYCTENMDHTIPLDKRTIEREHQLYCDKYKLDKTLKHRIILNPMPIRYFWSSEIAYCKENKDMTRLYTMTLEKGSMKNLLHMLDFLNEFQLIKILQQGLWFK